VEEALALLINEVVIVGQRLVLVLDDYHQVESVDVHRSLAYLLEHLPSSWHIVIATRADPPLPLSLLRGRGALLELRAADLAFTQPELAAFLAKTTGMTLPRTSVIKLAQKTEGWAAGLQMVALALRGSRASVPQASTDDLVDGMAKTERYLLDYLVDEVFSHLDPTTQSFLLRTSILEAVNGPLSDALVGDAIEVDGSSILQDLVHANLFVSQLDGPAPWYRYHRLFSELLQKRLLSRDLDLVPELHRRASTWYQEASMPFEAIHHALAAADFGRAVSLIALEVEHALMRSEHVTVLSWLSSLPEDGLLSRPDLCVYHAWALVVVGGSPDLIEARLAQAAAGPQTSHTQGTLAALQASRALLAGDPAGCVRLAQQALDTLPEESEFFQAISANLLGIARLSLGELAGAETALRHVVDLATASGNTMMAVAALSNLAGAAVVRGKLRRAHLAYEEALRLATDKYGRRLPVAVRALMGLGELKREANQLDASAACLAEALELCERYGELGTVVVLVTLARIRLTQGATQEAQALISRADVLARASRATQLDDRLVRLARVHTWLHTAQLDSSAGWVSAYGAEIVAALERVSSIEGPPPGDLNFLEAEGAMLARAHLVLSDPDVALAVLTELLDIAQRRGRERRLVELLVLKAIALSDLGRDTAALETMRHALAVAEPEGYVRSFLDEGAVAHKLVDRVLTTLDAGPLCRYCQHLINAFGAQRTQASDAEHQQPGATELLPEALSDRELDVLVLIAAGFTNREIGLELAIALNTVKGHTREIYSKLDVHSRTQAVAKARELGLLPTE
jgi:LuxR family maltose regulon positive regulatory protein